MGGALGLRRDVRGSATSPAPRAGGALERELRPLDVHRGPRRRDAHAWDRFGMARDGGRDRVASTQLIEAHRSPATAPPAQQTTNPTTATNKPERRYQVDGPPLPTQGICHAARRPARATWTSSWIPSRVGRCSIWPDCVWISATRLAGRSTSLPRDRCIRGFGSGSCGRSSRSCEPQRRLSRGGLRRVLLRRFLDSTYIGVHPSTISVVGVIRGRRSPRHVTGAGCAQAPFC